VAFTVCFAVWMMFGVTGIPIRTQLGLDSTQFGLLSATPVLSGAVFRLPLGVWTDRFGGRRIMLAVLVGCAVPLFVSAYATAYWQLLLLGLALGLVGATFSVGTPYVARFFPASKRGFAMGVFGAGTIGAAINMFVAPTLIGAFGWQSVPKTYAVVLLVTAVFFWVVSVPDPARRDPGSPSIARQLGVLRDPRAWKYCQYYSIVFGGFTALSIWMPQYFKTEYGLPITAAALLAACFALPGGGFRALGGWLADRFGAHAVTWWVLWIAWICLFLLSYPRTELSIATMNGPLHFGIALPVWLFTVLLFVLGIAFACGMASTFKYIGNDYPDSMGVVSGIVGMVGGLGGFLLPIMFGALLDKTGINSSCFMLLYGIVSISLMLNYLTEVRRAPVMGEPVLSSDSAEGAA
jgi:NNP family nitrate/nitrite transporter-like MFS transporter